MRLIFLHGLGQTASSWDQVSSHFKDHEVICPELFDNGRLPENLDQLKEKVNQLLADSDKNSLVIGVSLGGLLALSLLENPHPNLKGIVSCAGQYRFRNNQAFRLQVAIFKLLPKRFFKKQGWDKANILAFYKGIADIDMTEDLLKTQLPCHLVCGEKDTFNLKTSQELQKLIPNSQLTILKNTGHESNKDNLNELSFVIKDFIERVEHVC